MRRSRALGKTAAVLIPHLVLEERDVSDVRSTLDGCRGWHPRADRALAWRGNQKWQIVSRQRQITRGFPSPRLNVGAGSWRLQSNGLRLATSASSTRGAVALEDHRHVAIFQRDIVHDPSPDPDGPGGQLLGAPRSAARPVPRPSGRAMSGGVRQRFRYGLRSNRRPMCGNTHSACRCAAAARPIAGAHPRTAARRPRRAGDEDKVMFETVRQDL
jgi:hypothetical protein